VPHSRYADGTPIKMAQGSDTDQSENAGIALLKVCVIEDIRVLRDGYRALIDGTDGFRCAGTFRTMEEAIEQMGASSPNAVLVDLGLPGMGGIEGIRILKQRYPSLVLITLTVYDEDDRIFDALCAGACGYLLKKTPPARLLECIREAVSGGSPMSPEIARRVVELFREIRPPKHADYRLTPHELRLLKLLVEGHNYKSAASELGTSYNTICFHIKQIYGKLQVHSKSEAVSTALRQRLIR
jgi:DNA-binding NarL/FixJ family response regulator